MPNTKEVSMLHYEMPDAEQNHTVSFSGGRTSAYLVYEIEKRVKNLGWKVEYVFMDTGAEHPKTYQFIRDAVDHFKIDLTCLRMDTQIEMGKGVRPEVIGVGEIGPNLLAFSRLVKKYGTPSLITPWCTARMKVDIVDKYRNKKYGKGNYVTWLGIRADETRRCGKNRHFRYLAEISDFTKMDVIRWWSKMPFDLQIEEHLGNCVFCIKKGPGKLALAARDSPEEYEKFLGMIKSKDNRQSPRIQDDLIMYRGNKTLEEIIEDFQEFSSQEIRDTLRFTKKYDSGSCSESCEIYVTD